MESEYIEKTLETLSQLEPGQKLYIRLGMIHIDKNPNRIRRWFKSCRKIMIYYHIEQIVDLAFVLGIDFDFNLIDNAFENYKKTYRHRLDVQENFTKLQQRIRNNLNSTTTN
jgi:hypothetical protein